MKQPIAQVSVIFPALCDIGVLPTILYCNAKSVLQFCLRGLGSCSDRRLPGLNARCDRVKQDTSHAGGPPLATLLQPLVSAVIDRVALLRLRVGHLQSSIHYCHYCFNWVISARREDHCQTHLGTHLSKNYETITYC